MKITKLEDFEKEHLYLFKSKPPYGEYTETIAALYSEDASTLWFNDVHFICGIDCDTAWEISQESLDKDWEVQEIRKEENPEYWL